MRAGRGRECGGRPQRRSRAGRRRGRGAAKSPRRSIPRQILEAMPALAALQAAPRAGATYEPAGAGPGASRAAASAREAAPGPRLGREARREIGSHAADSASSCRLARGITCPPPGVNRDPPAQAPAGTFRPGGRPRAAAPQRRQAARAQNNPFARGAALPDRHPTKWRQRTSSARPQARRAADICARSGG